MGWLVRAEIEIEPPVVVAPSQHPKELRRVVHEPVIERALCGQIVDHDAAWRHKIMYYLERVHLVRNMLGRPEVCHQMMLASERRRNAVEIEVKRHATRAAIDINRAVREP